MIRQLRQRSYEPGLWYPQARGWLLAASVAWALNAALYAAAGVTGGNSVPSVTAHDPAGIAPQPDVATLVGVPSPHSTIAGSEAAETQKWSLAAPVAIGDESDRTSFWQQNHVRAAWESEDGDIEPPARTTTATEPEAGAKPLLVPLPTAWSGGITGLTILGLIALMRRSTRMLRRV